MRSLKLCLHGRQASAVSSPSPSLLHRLKEDFLAFWSRACLSVRTLKNTNQPGPPPYADSIQPRVVENNRRHIINGWCHIAITYYLVRAVFSQWDRDEVRIYSMRVVLSTKWRAWMVFQRGTVSVDWFHLDCKWALIVPSTRDENFVTDCYITVT